jgi:hypothetical protein
MEAPQAQGMSRKAGRLRGKSAALRLLGMIVSGWAFPDLQDNPLAAQRLLSLHNRRRFAAAPFD